ncbi:molybdopterin cofactor-binding domain-containing protein [uncultured Sphingomonas sp.]|uniref:xanthine dehydrogenase family protein molybdopterin-binding subunit n=1 Tax=uncultured Sphingomonas sp. TaxID=158754 RepID=UPI0025F87E4F|nr:molybdopterin cofactor-binding domain-containing protein [uncultured Sphingomonas sp.]
MQLSRRAFLAGGVVVGVAVAWQVWPRAEQAALPTADGEIAFGGWIKIGKDGHIVVAVPQCEHGQGVYTALAQIAADELGADWRTVGVEASPESSLYANPLGTAAVLGTDGGWFADAAPMLTGGSTSIRQFEGPVRAAAAATRTLLCKAAAREWGIDWETCLTRDGFVVLGERRARFGDLAVAAVQESLPQTAQLRVGDDGRLTGTPAPRLDAPSKVDGSANFAGDLRLPNMVFASIRQGPFGDSRLIRYDTAAADNIPGVLRIVATDRWIAAVGSTWWAANQALGALAPRFETAGPLADHRRIAAALDAALDADGTQIAGAGDVAATFAGGRVFRADYRVAAGVPAAIEPITATASFEHGKLVLWMATQAPGLARAAAARALGIGEGSVVLHPMMAGGSFGAALEVTVAEQVAYLARELERPVQLTWSRAESLMHTPVRAPAVGRMSARLDGRGMIAAWRTQVATPPVGPALRARLAGRTAPGAVADPVAIDGASPAYRLPAWGVSHHPADIGVPVGYTRGGAHIASCFFTESFVDELARQAESEPLSYRIAMLGGAPRLARCLSTVASLGGWQGGTPGGGQGIAAYAMAGSYIALMVEGSVGDGGVPRVERMVAAVDVGHAVNPDLVRQQIEGGLIYGLAAAVGASTGYSGGLADVRSFRDLLLPRLGTSPDITVELIDSRADAGGASELAVPVVAPALANAIFAATGRRIRTLPL